MTRQLHAVLAVEPSLANTAKELAEEAKNTFSKKPDQFRGHNTVVTFFDAARGMENTSDTKNINTTVDDKLSYVVAEIAKLYDGLATKEATNQISKSDLVVDGIVLGKDLPGTFLLGLEKRLVLLRELLLTVPTLDPSFTWKVDPNLPPGVFVTEPQKAHKTELVYDFLEITKATDKHPAQMKEVSAQRPVASIAKTNQSGMWSVDRKAKVLAKLELLLRAVTESRINSAKVDAVETKVGSKIFDYLLAY